MSSEMNYQNSMKNLESLKSYRLKNFDLKSLKNYRYLRYLVMNLNFHFDYLKNLQN